MASVDDAVTRLPVNVAAIASRFGISVELTDTERRDGWLERAGSSTVIHLNPKRPYGRQQFTLTHEFGHYLLEHVEGVPLDDQRVDPNIERYCDQFAREVLLPRVWVTEQFSDAPHTMATIDRLAGRTGTSVSASIHALNAYLSWGAGLLIWRQRRDLWRIAHKAIHPALRGKVLSAEETSQIIDDQLRPRPFVQARRRQMFTLPLLVREELAYVPAQLQRGANSVATLLDFSLILKRPAEPSHSRSRPTPRVRRRSGSPNSPGQLSLELNQP